MWNEISLNLCLFISNMVPRLVPRSNWRVLALGEAVGWDPVTLHLPANNFIHAHLHILLAAGDYDARKHQRSTFTDRFKSNCHWRHRVVHLFARLSKRTIRVNIKWVLTIPMLLLFSNWEKKIEQDCLQNCLQDYQQTYEANNFLWCSSIKETTCILRYQSLELKW